MLQEQASDQIEQRVISHLKRSGVPYEIVRIDPTFADTAAFCEKYGFPLQKSANTIIVASKKEPKQYAACVVLAHTRLDVNHKVKELMGVSRLSFADASETANLTGMMIGGVTALALPEDLAVYVDSRVITCDWIILGGGSRSVKIKVSPEVLTVRGPSKVVEALAKEA